MSKLLVKKDKFYKFIKGSHAQISKNTVGGGYSSSTANFEKGIIFKGNDSYSLTKVYDGMPVTETKHEVLLEGLSLFKTNNDYLVNTDVESFEDGSFEEISEEEYLETSKQFRDRPRYEANGGFVNFLAQY